MEHHDKAMKKMAVETHSKEGKRGDECLAAEARRVCALAGAAMEHGERAARKAATLHASISAAITNCIFSLPIGYS